MNIVRIAFFDATNDQLTIPFSISPQETTFVQSETRHVLAKALFDVRLNHSMVQVAFNNQYFYLKKEKANIVIFATDEAIAFGSYGILNGINKNVEAEPAIEWSRVVACAELNYQRMQTDPQFQRKTAALKNNIAATKVIMQDNMVKVAEQHKTLCCLLERTKDLSECAITFKSRAISVYHKKDLSFPQKLSHLFCCFFMCSSGGEIDDSPKLLRSRELT